MKREDVKSAILLLQDQLPMIGSGNRPVLYFVASTGYAYVFWMPTLSVHKVHPNLWATITKSERHDHDIGARATAIAANVSGAKTRGAWDGGKRVEKLLELLLSGHEVDEKEFDGEEAESVAVQAKAKEIPATDFPFKEKDRVTLDYDKDFKGTIKRAGPEVSTITPDGEKSKELHIPNANIAKLPPEAGTTPASTKETTVGSATGKAKKPAKAAKPAKVKTEKPKKESSNPFAKVRIVITIDKNPRAEGSLAHTRFANMQRRVKAHPDWSAQQILEAGAEDKVPYRAIDLRADEDRKSIKLVSL